VDAITYNLKKEGYEVDSAADADECLERVVAAPPDLVILDVMLPSGSGLDICRRLHREKTHLPVLLLTARAAEVDRLRGFEAGADDYVVKPFSMRELIARVQVLLRRMRGVPPDEAATVPDDPYSLSDLRLIVNAERREVLKDGRHVSLSRKEFDLLSFMAANRGRVFDRQTLLSRVWGEDCYVDDRTVDVHIRWLREKLEEKPAHPELFVTVRGVGYKFQS
jgi:DNA-binding response OmpR family regulator